MSVTQAQPLALTKAVRDVSVTERNGFKQCRRRWTLEVIENLEPKNVQQWALEFGTGIHSALEEFYRVITKHKGTKAERVAKAHESALTAFEIWHNEQYDKMGDTLTGLMLESARSELWQMYQLGIKMLDNYVLYAKQEDNFKVIAVEGEVISKTPLLKKLNPPYSADARPVRHESGRILVPIVDPATKEVLIRTTFDTETGEKVTGPVYLSARIDLLIEDTSPQFKGLWVKDHKTSSGSISDRGLDFDDQITGYCYVVWRLTGIIPRGVVFNYLIKNEPKEPRILKDESLSTAKDQLTLPHLYKQALKDHGLMKGSTITSEKHAECYAALLAKGWDPFFRRHKPQRNAHELEMFEKRLVQEVLDMADVAENPGKAYPHLSAWHCGSCSVNALCNAMERGEDVDFIRENMFQQAEDRKAV